MLFFTFVFSLFDSGLFDFDWLLRLLLKDFVRASIGPCLPWWSSDSFFSHTRSIFSKSSINGDLLLFLKSWTLLSILFKFCIAETYPLLLLSWFYCFSWLASLKVDILMSFYSAFRLSERGGLEHWKVLISWVSFDSLESGSSNWIDFSVTTGNGIGS